MRQLKPGEYLAYGFDYDPDDLFDLDSTEAQEKGDVIHKYYDVQEELESRRRWDILNGARLVGTVIHCHTSMMK